jgi:hypothetical protein
MSYGEIVEAQAKRDAKEATARNGGNAMAGQGERLPRRCSRCKETGHNSRTCKKDAVDAVQ